MSHTTTRLLVVFLVAISLVGLNSFRVSTAQDEAATTTDDAPPPDDRPAGPKVADSDRRAKLESTKQEFFPAMNEAQQRIEAILDEKTTINFVDTPLNDVVLFLATQHDTPIILDIMALEDEGIATDEPINLVLTNVSLRSALHVMLTPLGMTFEPRNDILYVSTENESMENLVNRVYPIADLVTADEKSYDELVTAIETTTETHWIEQEGEGGSVAVIKANASVSILQTYRGHQAVVKFLRSMRQARVAQGPISVPHHHDHNHDPADLDITADTTEGAP